jgi:hypothetical protein
MLEAVLALVIVGGFFVLRAVVATWVFLYLLPEGDRCPNCDAVTLHVASKGWNTLMPWFRTSWCLECGWHGLLRKGPLTPERKPDGAGVTLSAAKGKDLPT